MDAHVETFADSFKGDQGTIWVMLILPRLHSDVCNRYWVHLVQFAAKSYTAFETLPNIISRGQHYQVSQSALITESMASGGNVSRMSNRTYQKGTA